MGRDKDVEQQEMKEIDPSEDDQTSDREADSGHASDDGSSRRDDNSHIMDDDRSDKSSVSEIINDRKEWLKRRAKARIRKCIMIVSAFWKIILFLIQLGVLGGLGLLAYYMKFTDLFPVSGTFFDCEDIRISQDRNISAFDGFIFGEHVAAGHVDEDWIYVFSWVAPPGIMLFVEAFYSVHTGCSLSQNLKTPLIVRRCCRIIGVYFFGIVAVLLIAESAKLFITSPRPYFMDICKPNLTECSRQASLSICTETDLEKLKDARTSFPSLPSAALSYACLFIGAYLHQMLNHAKAFILQPLMALTFMAISFSGGFIEIGIKRSHWYDVLAAFILGYFLAAYMVLTLNCFVEKFQPPVAPRKEAVWVQTDPEPDHDSEYEYPYDIVNMGKLPRRKQRQDDDDMCCHRATSFDNTFQSDLARSLNMFKSMDTWTNSQAPTFDPDRGFYDQPLPEGILPVTQTADRLSPAPPSPTASSIRVPSPVSVRSARATPTVDITVIDAISDA